MHGNNISRYDFYIVIYIYIVKQSEIIIGTTFKVIIFVKLINILNMVISG